MSAQADKTPHPSRPLADPPSPTRGEGTTAHRPATARPSPLVGEGAQRADEGDLASQSTRLRNFARSMRRKPTEAEQALWLLLRDRRFLGFKFRRQVPLGPYVADFVCYASKLVIEADGLQHAESARDLIRDAELSRRGFRLLRLWNHDILARPQGVAELIWSELQGGKP